jgi:hypothetical protein
MVDASSMTITIEDFMMMPRGAARFHHMAARTLDVVGSVYGPVVHRFRGKPATSLLQEDDEPRFVSIRDRTRKIYRHL